MTTKSRNKQVKTEKRPMIDVLPDDFHLNLFSDTMIEKSEYGDTMALIKDVATYYKELCRIPEKKYFNFSFGAKAPVAPLALTKKIEAANSNRDLFKAYDSIGNRTYSKIPPLTANQAAQIQNMMYRAKMVQEGLTRERNLITFEKRHPEKSEKFRYANPVFRDTYDEALKFSKEMQQYNQPETLREVATSVIFRITGVLKSIVVLPISSPGATSIFIPMVVNFVLVPAGLPINFAAAAILGVNFIVNLAPAYTKYMDGRKYEEETSTIMALAKIVSTASVETFFVSGVTQITGFIFAEGYLKIAAGILIPVVGRLVMSSEYKQANIKAAMEQSIGTEELRLQNELMGKNRDLKNFWKGTDRIGYFTRVVTNILNQVDMFKNVTFSVPLIAHDALYKTALYKSVVDACYIVWTVGFSPVNLIVYMCSQIYEKLVPPNTVSSEEVIIVEDEELEISIKWLCQKTGIAFKKVVSMGLDIVNKVWSTCYTIAMGMPGFAWKVISLAALGAIGFFFSDLLNAIPANVMVDFFLQIPIWLYYCLTGIGGHAVSFIMILLKAIDCHELPINVWNNVKETVLTYADWLYVYLIQNIKNKAKEVDVYMWGCLSTIYHFIKKEAPQIAYKVPVNIIGSIQNFRNWMFAQTHLKLSGLLGNPDTLQLGIRITSLGLSTAFFASMVVGMFEAPAFLYKTYERIVLTHIKVMAISAFVVAGVLQVLVSSGVILATMSPLAVLGLAIGWINSNYISLVPGATEEIRHLINSYLFRLAESEDILLYFRGIVSSQASGILMSGIRSNLSAYLAVYLPFVTTMLYQDLTGAQLDAWTTFTIALTSGVVGYTGLSLFGCTRFGIKLKQCVAAIQSISIGSTFRNANFLFKWYVKDSDVLDTAFTEMFKWVFLEVYTGTKINLLTQKIASEFAFNKEFFEDLTPEEIKTIADEDRASTDKQIKKLEKAIEEYQNVQIDKSNEARQTVLDYKPDKRGYTDEEKKILFDINDGTNTTSDLFKSSVLKLGEINPAWKQTYDSIVGQSLEIDAAIRTVRSEIAIAKDFHKEFVSMLSKHRVDPFSVLSNGFINEMAFWRQPDPVLMSERVAAAQKFSDKIADVQVQMQDALGNTFSDVENVFHSTRKFRLDVLQAVGDESQKTKTKVANLINLNFGSRYNNLSELTSDLKRSVADNKSLHRIDRKLEMLQSRAVHFVLAEASKKSTFGELDVLKKTMLQNSFAGRLTDKLNLALDACSIDLTMARQNALSVEKNKYKTSQAFYDVLKPLSDRKYQDTAELIVRMKKALETQERFNEIAETTLLSRLDLETRNSTRDKDNFLRKLYFSRQKQNSLLTEDITTDKYMENEKYEWIIKGFERNDIPFEGRHVTSLYKESSLNDKYTIEQAKNDEFYENVIRKPKDNQLNPDVVQPSEDNRSRETTTVLSKSYLDNRDKAIYFEKQYKIPIHRPSDSEFYRAVVEPSKGDRYQPTADLIAGRVGALEKSLTEIKRETETSQQTLISPYEKEQREKTIFLKKLGYRNQKDRDDAAKDFGHLVNHDILEATDIFKFSEEQRKRLTLGERELLKYAKIGLDLRPKAPPTSIIPIDTSKLEKLLAPPRDRQASATTGAARRGFLIPILSKRPPAGVPVVKIAPLIAPREPTTVAPREPTTVAPAIVSDAIDILDRKRVSTLRALAVLGVKKGGFAKATGILTSTTLGTATEITINTKTGTRTTTDYGGDDDSLKDNPDRSSVFGSHREPLKERPEGAQTVLTQGLLEFKDNSGNFKYQKFDNWYRLGLGRGIKVSISDYDVGVRSMPGFVEIMEEWRKKIGSLSVDNFDDSEINRTWVEDNITLMAYSEEFSKKLEKIVLTDDILKKIYPVDAHRKNIVAAFDEKTTTAANPLFLWTLSKERAPPLISDVKDPYKNVRENLLERANKLIEIKNKEPQERYETNIKIFISEAKKMNLLPDPEVGNLESEPPAAAKSKAENKEAEPPAAGNLQSNEETLPELQKYSPDSWRNYEFVDSTMNVATKAKDTAGMVIQTGAGFFSWGLEYALGSTAYDILIAAPVNALSYAASGISSTVGVLYDSSSVSYETTMYVRGMTPLISKQERNARLYRHILQNAYENAPKEKQEGYFGEVYRACTRALNDQEENRKSIIGLEYTAPYQGITGESFAGQILQNMNYQDLENRYMPKKEIILAENFQYKPDVMKMLFKPEILKPKEEYVDEINGYITAINFETMRKNSAQERQEDG